MILRGVLLALLLATVIACGPRDPDGQVSGPYLGGAGGYNARGGSSFSIH